MSTYNVRGKRTGPGVRKERRKAARVQKRSTKLTPTASRTARILARSFKPSNDASSFMSINDDHQTASIPGTATVVKPVKSILKKSKTLPLADRSLELESELQRPQSQISPSVKDHLVADDAEIEALEKALGIKGKKKLPKSFEEDGLDTLLDGLDGSSGEDLGSTKRKRVEEDEWLRAKRRKALEKNAVDEQGLDSKKSSDQESASDICEQLTIDEEDDSSHESFESFDTSTQGELPNNSSLWRIRKNPYIAPNNTHSALPTAKYVPPSRRPLNSSTREDLQLLRRQLRGSINRLSESNLLSILRDVERQYREHARQDVSNTLLDLLLPLLSDPTILEDTFIILHAGLIAAVYKVIGTEFGAQIVQRIVTEFDAMYPIQRHGDESGKKLTNLISLLSQLYNFQVIGSNLMYDYIERFLEELSEINTELLLKIIRSMYHSENERICCAC